MRDITIPIHLVIPSLLCAVALVSILLKRGTLFIGRHRTALWSAILVLLVVYGSVVGLAVFYDMYYQWDLIRYDLDKDGFFGGEEVTREQEAALERLVNDTGRNFSPVTALVPSLLIALVCYVLFRTWMITSKIWNKGRTTLQ